MPDTGAKLTAPPALIDPAPSAFGSNAARREIEVPPFRLRQHERAMWPRALPRKPGAGAAFFAGFQGEHGKPPKRFRPGGRELRGRAKPRRLPEPAPVEHERNVARGLAELRAALAGHQHGKRPDNHA